MTEAAPFHIAILKHPGGDYIGETTISQATFADMVRDVREGQIEDVVKIYAIDPAAGTVKDVTLAVAEAVNDHYNNREEEPFPSLYRWLSDLGLDVYAEMDDDCDNRRDEANEHSTYRVIGGRVA